MGQLEQQSQVRHRYLLMTRLLVLVTRIGLCVLNASIVPDWARGCGLGGNPAVCLIGLVPDWAQGCVVCVTRFGLLLLGQPK